MPEVSLNSIKTCLALLAKVSVPLTAPSSEWENLASTRDELIAALVQKEVVNE